MDNKTENLSIAFSDIREGAEELSRKVLELRTKNNAMCVVEAIKKIREFEFWASEATKYEALAKD